MARLSQTVAETLISLVFHLILSLPSVSTMVSYKGDIQNHERAYKSKWNFRPSVDHCPTPYEHRNPT